METPDFSVRRAGPDDAARLSLIGQATFLESFADILPGSDVILHCQSQHSIRDYAARLSGGADHALWLAELRKGAPIGYAALAPPDFSTVEVVPGDIELKRIYLLSRFHGSGIAGALMDEAVAYARSLGRRRLLLGVYGRNGRAIRFYQKNGMTIIGTRQFLVGENRYDDVVMAKEL
jgi:ribosomal protein S18 acetylase RimI-like enzyme